jgi:hypothetical protein
LNGPDVDGTSDRLAVGTLPNDDDLRPVRGLFQTARALDRLIERHAAGDGHDPRVTDLAVDVDPVQPGLPDDDADLRVGELAGVAFCEVGIELVPGETGCRTSSISWSEIMPSDRTFTSSFSSGLV